ncbi:DUF1657 domain-containing protein [Bacillus taeanensis]|uniref:Uncharacterized protein n=1 Tax=Bacillus taeanensis TaxID=273032 RepID=A0A366XS05_9BACI|nr:hypothetical protein DS031_17570 [Bacillus taeanensis]
MKKCQDDLELFALATDNESAKQMYTRNAEKKLTKRLQKYSDFRAGSVLLRNLLNDHNNKLC